MTGMQPGAFNDEEHEIFGTSVSLSSDAIGAVGDDNGNGDDAGSVSACEFDIMTENWTQRGEPILLIKRICS